MKINNNAEKQFKRCFSSSKENNDGVYILDSTGKQIIANYERYLPEFNSQTYIAIAYIGLGILIVLGLEWYGQRTKREHI